MSGQKDMRDEKPFPPDGLVGLGVEIGEANLGEELREKLFWLGRSYDKLVKFMSVLSDRHEGLMQMLDEWEGETERVLMGINGGGGKEK